MIAFQSAEQNRSLLDHLWLRVSSVDLLWTGGALVVWIVFLFAVRFALGKARSSPTKSFRIQTIMIVLTVVGAILVALTLPNEHGTRDAVMTLIGLVLSATIALSSTTILGNALAGVQLRVVGAFKTGDFLRVGEHFGCVSERGLFHTEIQTEESDLTTLPNLYLVNNPYKVVDPTGTFITADVSIGYDTPHSVVEENLVAAAEDAGLDKPYFVSVLELGDFTIGYRVAGKLVKQKGQAERLPILSIRSRLRKRMIDRLHGAGVEIMSPTIMATRRIPADEPLIPETVVVKPEAEAPPEAEVFQKGLEAGELQAAKDQLDKCKADLADASKRKRAAKDEEKANAERDVDRLTAECETLAGKIEELEHRLRAAADDSA